MVEDDKADEEADGVVQEVTKVLLDLGVLRKHIDDILEKSVQCSFACVHLSALRRHKGSTLEASHMSVINVIFIGPRCPWSDLWVRLSLTD